MNSIRLENFRAFKDTGVIEIKPITILVGNNSSGKSSFLRFLPLLKQSLEESKHGPLLWYKENGVDFDKFSTSVHNGENYIKMSFSITPRYHGYALRDKSNVEINISISIEKESQNSDYDYVKSVSFKYSDVEIDITINRKKCKADVLINGVEMPQLQYFSRSNQQLFPALYLENNFKVQKFEDVVAAFCQDKRLFTRSYDDFLLMPKYEFDEKMSTLSDEDKMKTFAELTFANIPDLVQLLEMNIRFEMNAVSYIGPFRDSPQRYYRAQNLSSHNIDMKGSNIAIFLSELEEERMKELNKNLFDHYKFELDIRKDFGQISIYIIRDGKTTNIIDNGFGYSQILPVILALYTFDKRKMNIGGIKMPNTICIEQPELHLHPLMQYRIGKSLTDMISSTNFEKQAKIDNKIIIETHSRSLIEALGEAISKKEVNPDAIAVYIFSQSEGAATIDKASFDDDGYLTNWPIGFLD